MIRQPSLFISHGAPTFAVEPGTAGAQLAALGRRLAKPAAAVIVSPHWMTRGIAVTASAQPETIHDFGGFPAALYELKYPAPGEPELARRLAKRFADAGIELHLDERRGLDHGAWVPLMHLFPDADVPVLQVSMPVSLDPRGAWRLGELLMPLRDEGILVIGSGSLTHNLHDVLRGGAIVQPEYARQFVDWARRSVQSHDRDALVGYLGVAPHAGRAHPTSDHYLPLLVAAAAGGNDPVTVIDGGIVYEVLSMESYVFGTTIQ